MGGTGKGRRARRARRPAAALPLAVTPSRPRFPRPDGPPPRAHGPRRRLRARPCAHLEQVCNLPGVEVEVHGVVVCGGAVERLLRRGRLGVVGHGLGGLRLVAQVDGWHGASPFVGSPLVEVAVKASHGRLAGRGRVALQPPRASACERGSTRSRKVFRSPTRCSLFCPTLLLRQTGCHTGPTHPRQRPGRSARARQAGAGAAANSAARAGPRFAVNNTHSSPGALPETTSASIRARTKSRRGAIARAPGAVKPPVLLTKPVKHFSVQSKGASRRLRASLPLPTAGRVRSCPLGLGRGLRLRRG